LGLCLLKIKFQKSAGVLLSKHELHEISDICKEANCWLVGFILSVAFLES
jgi:threonine aldolase